MRREMQRRRSGPSPPPDGRTEYTSNQGPTQDTSSGKLITSTIPEAPSLQPLSLRHHNFYSPHPPQVMLPTPEMLLNPPHTGDLKAYLDARQARLNQRLGGWTNITPQVAALGINPKHIRLY
ncbi:hypothetical protein PLICRDRAFT_36773 [Plicaturopsis crispa FD-325 SS-3]|nr:hypothetical protein PLICRDRAFT_36773 [Plicaturopsis crispa FD-325 SS-3]